VIFYQYSPSKAGRLCKNSVT